MILFGYSVVLDIRFKLFCLVPLLSSLTLYCKFMDLAYSFEGSLLYSAVWAMDWLQSGHKMTYGIIKAIKAVLTSS